MANHEALLSDLRMDFCMFKENSFKKNFERCFSCDLYPEMQGAYDNLFQSIVHELTKDKRKENEQASLVRMFDFVASKSVERNLQPNYPLLVDMIGHGLLNYDNHYKDYKLVEVFGYIQQRFPAFNVDTKSQRYGVTMLMYAIASKRSEASAIDAFIALGADVNFMSDKHGRPLHFLNKEDLRIVEKLKTLSAYDINIKEEFDYHHFDEFVKWGPLKDKRFLYRSIHDYVDKNKDHLSKTDGGGINRWKALNKVLNEAANNREALQSAGQYVEKNNSSRNKNAL